MFIGPPNWFPSRAFGETIAVILFGWFIAEFINGVIGRRGSGTQQVKDRGSYWVIVLTVDLNMAIAYVTRWFGVGVLTGTGQYLGLALMILGIILREWAIIVLGRYFTVTVTIRSDHHLVTSGPYRWLRHPAYTGSLLTLIGVPLALGTWAGLLLDAVLSLLAYGYRMRVEEKALLDAFGDEYRAYMRHTWRVLPGW